MKLLRPWYERILDLTTGGRGYARVINGVERLWVHPRYRGYMPATYEPASYHFLRSNVRPGDVVLNVGAHLGVYALSLGRWVGSQGRVYAFEPNPSTAAILTDHVRRNGLIGRVSVMQVAVGEEAGEGEFVAAGIEGFSRIGRAHPAQAKRDATRVEVAVTTLDAFCAERNILPDWIVMDIEGYELAALRGARQTIAEAGTKLQWVVECHPELWEEFGDSFASATELLGTLGLVARSLDSGTQPCAAHGAVHLRFAGTPP